MLTGILIMCCVWRIIHLAFQGKERQQREYEYAVEDDVNVTSDDMQGNKLNIIFRRI
jgi:hypothetical protein